MTKEEQARIELSQDIVKMYDLYKDRKSFDTGYFSLYIYTKILDQNGLLRTAEFTEDEIKAMKLSLSENGVINYYEKKHIRKDEELLKKQFGRENDLKSLELSFAYIRDNNIDLPKVLGL